VPSGHRPARGNRRGRRQHDRAVEADLAGNAGGRLPPADARRPGRRGGTGVLRLGRPQGEVKAPMTRLSHGLFQRLGGAPRGFVALTRALILTDLRGQHFARATATRPGALLSPLFLVIGQCLTLSALLSFLLFSRVDVWFYSFVSLTLSMLL